MGILRAIADAARPRADAPVPYVSRRQIGFATPVGAGAEAQMLAVTNVGTLFSVVESLTGGTAKWDWWLERDVPARGRQPASVEPVLSHPALDLWNQPNAFMSRRDLMEIAQQHVELAGEGYVVVARASKTGPPMELWPVRPDRIAPQPDPKNFLKGWTYFGPDGEKVPLGVDEVIQLKYMPHPLDPYHGIGPVQAIMPDLEATRYSALWSRNFFLNSALPGGIIRYDRRLDDDEYDELTARWREQHQGVAAAHRVAVIEEGEWVERKFSMKDMQFSELRTVSREIIREAFRVSKTMLGQAEDVNRASAQAAEYVFGAWLIDPRLTRWQGVLQSRLLPMFGTAGKGYRWRFEDPSPKDEVAEGEVLAKKTEAYKTLVDAGVDPDDAAEVVGLPPMRHRAASAPAPAPALAPAARQHWHPPAWAAASDEALERVQGDWESALDDVLADWPDVAEAQRAEIRDQVVEAIDDGDVESLTSMTVDTAAAAALLEAAMVALSAAAADRVVEEAEAQGVAIDPVPADAATLGAYAAMAAGVLAAGLVASAAREAVRRNREGSTGEEVADAVDEHLAGLTDAAVRTEAGGALTCAQNQARLATLRAAPAAKWVATEVNDVNRCGPCGEVDEHEFVDLDEAEDAYPNGGYIACLGGVRCRGTVRASWEDVAARTDVVPLAYAPWARTNGSHPVAVG